MLGPDVRGARLPETPGAAPWLMAGQTATVACVGSGVGAALDRCRR